MSQWVYAIIAIPFVSAAVLALLPGYRLPAVLNVIASLMAFLAALNLLNTGASVDGYLIVDAMNTIFVILITFVGFTTAAYSASYIGHEIDTGRITAATVRFYHPLYQAMLGSMSVALLSNNIGLLWVGLELATLITIVMVGLYRTRPAIEAAWKYFILGGVGISLAFFGTILTYLAGQVALGDGQPAMSWTLLHANAGKLDPSLLSLAFVFLLVGYGTKVGLVPLHAWLPDAHSEGPTPICAVLSGLLLNVALYALLRFKMIIAGNSAAISPGSILMVMGLVSLIFAAFMLYRRRDIKRLFAYSSIEHMGLVTFAFGLGGPLANFAALLHMCLHSLTKSAIFFAVGNIAQGKGTQNIADIKGLSVTHPGLAVGLCLGVFAISGLPPFGIFASEFLILSEAFARNPWLAVLPVFGILLAFGALLLRMQGMLFGKPVGEANEVKATSLPLILHLILVLIAGLFLPAALVALFQQAAEVIG